MKDKPKTRREQNRGSVNRGKKRMKKILLIGGILFVLAIVGMIALWQFYSYYQSPERFVERARELEAEGEYEAASDQYQRALQRTGSSSLRANIMNSIIENQRAQPPAPPQEVRGDSRTILELSRGIFQMAEDKDEPARRILDDAYSIAEHLESRSSWQELKDLAELVIRLDEDNLQARKYLNIARLFTTGPEDRSERFYSRLREEFEILRESGMAESGIVYYHAMSLASQATDIEADYLRERQRSLFDQAMKVMNEYIQEHPEDIEIRVRRLRIFIQHLIRFPDQDKVKWLVDELEDLQHELSRPERERYRAAVELGRVYFRVARIVGHWAMLEPEESVQFPLNEDELQARALGLLEQVVEPDTVLGLQALSSIAQIKIAQDERGEALVLLDQILDEEEVRFSPGVKALIAWRQQLQSRIERLDLWLEGYERDKGEEYLRKTEDEIVILAEMMGEDHPLLQMMEGRFKYVQGAYRQALQKFEQTEEYLGSTPESLLFSGLALTRLGETGAAIAKLSSFMELRRGDAEQRRRALDSLAECAARLRNFDRALQIRRRLLEESPEWEQARLGLVETLVSRSNFHRRGLDQATMKEVEQALTPLIDQDHKRAGVLQARLYFETGRIQDAVDLLSGYHRQDIEDGLVDFLLYTGLRRLGKMEEAEELLKEVLVSSKDSRARDYLSKAAEGDSEWNDHTGHLIYSALQTDEVQRKLGLYQLLRQLERFSEAEQVLAELEELAPNERDVLELRFNIAFSEQDWERAETIAEQAAARPKMAHWADKLKARLDLARNNDLDAITRLQRMADEDATDSEVLLLLGQARNRQGDLSSAQEALEEAFSISPDNFNVVRQLINVSAARGLRSRAMRYMQHALRLAPHDSRLIQEFLARLEQFEEGSEQALQLRLQLAENQPENRENLLQIANLYLQEGHFKEAEILLQRLRGERPGDFAAVLLTGRLRALTGAPEEGKELISSFLQEHEDEVGAFSWVQYAEFLEQTGEAESEIIAAIEKGRSIESTDNPLATRHLADLRSRQGRADEALTLLAELYEQTGGNHWLLSMAEVELELGESESARQRIDSYLEREPMIGQAGLLLAKTQIAADDMENALDTLDRVIEMTPGYAEAYVQRARLWWEHPELKERGDSVREELNKALEHNPRLTEARHLLALRLLEEGELDESAEQFSKLIEEQPGNNQYRDNLVRIYLNQENYEELNEHLDQWSEQAPGPDSRAFLLATLWRGRLAREQGNPEQAIEYLTVVSEKVPQDPGVLNEYLNLLLSLERYEKAVELVRQAPGELRSSPSVQIDYGRALAGLGENEEARLAFTEAFAEGEGNIGFQERVVEIARQVLEREQISDLLPMLEPYDSGGVVEFYAALEELARGERGTAVQRLQELRTRFRPEVPIYMRTLQVLGSVLSEEASYEQAEEVLREAREHSPDNPVVLNNLAYVVAELGEAPYEAVELAEEALENISRREEDEQLRANVLDTLGYAQYRAGLLSYAVTTLERSLRLAELPNAYLTLGRVFLDQERPGEAAEMLEKALEHASGDEADIIGQAEELLARANEQIEKIAEAD